MAILPPLHNSLAGGVPPPANQPALLRLCPVPLTRPPLLPPVSAPRECPTPLAPRGCPTPGQSTCAPPPVPGPPDTPSAASVLLALRGCPTPVHSTSTPLPTPQSPWHARFCFGPPRSQGVSHPPSTQPELSSPCPTSSATFVQLSAAVGAACAARRNSPRRPTSIGRV
jgi:hypothetical protein